MFTFLFSSDRFGTCTIGLQAIPLHSPYAFVVSIGTVLACIPAKTEQERAKRFILKLLKVSCFKI